jgi:PAS domain S-box-containing protein
MSDIIKLKELASGLTVLYVEDNDELAKNFKKYLLKIFNNVETACNGQEALDKYKEKQFNIIISDINMPIMNGLELTKKIKEINKLQTLVLLSAYSDSKILLEAIKLGIDGYIVKPINNLEINTLLLKLCTNIKNSYENNINIEQQKQLMNHVSAKNTLLKQYTEIMDKVAIVSKTDLKGVITEVNDFFCEISGYTREELIGKSHNIVRHQDIPSSVYTKLWETIQKGELWEGTIKNKAKNGEEYYVHATIIPILDKNHDIEGYVGIRFLSTDEETQKRDFRKKVRTNIIEYKKTTAHLLKINNILEKEILIKNENEAAQFATIKDLNDLLEKSTNIDEYRKYGVMKNYSKNLEHITDKYKVASKQLIIKKEELTVLRDDHNLKIKELLNLDEELIRQRDIIKDLRNTIRSISKDQNNKKEEAEDTKKGSSIFSKFLGIK